MFGNKSSSVFQQRVKDAIKEDLESKQVIEDVLRLHLFRKAEKKEELLVLVELYDLLGPEKFADVLSILSGKTLTFPDKNDFRESIQFAISYYYRTFENKSWDEIKIILGEKDLPSIKLGIHIRQFQEFLEYLQKTRISVTSIIPKDYKNE